MTRLIAPVAGIGAIALGIGVVVFVETWRTIHGHPDAAPLSGWILVIIVAALAGAAGGRYVRRSRSRL